MQRAGRSSRSDAPDAGFGRAACSSEKRSGQEIPRVSPVLADMNLRHRVLISVLPISRSDDDNAVGAFWQNVRREGVVLDAG